MIGVILAAGVGSRLRPMTNNKPKCLVTTAGKAILDYQLEAYKNAGIKKIVVVVGYEGDAIKEHLKYNQDFDILIVDNDIYEDTNNMYSLYLTREIVRGEPFILNNADLSVDSGIIKKLLEDERENLVAIDTSIFNDESMKVTVNEDGYIIDISKAIDYTKSYGCSIDFYKFSRESSSVFFDRISQIIEVESNLKDWTEVAMQQLFMSQKLKFEPLNIEGLSWVEIDNYDDLALSDEIFSQRERKVTDYKHYCFDLDGTLYIGEKHIPRAVECIEYLESCQKKIYYLSNNSSKNKQDYIRKLESIGLRAQPEQIILSTDATIDFLHEMGVTKVFVLGTSSLKEMISQAGIELSDSDPQIVVIGYDTELDYQKLINACRLINNNIGFIATHCDLVCPSEFGPIPDIGLLTKLIEDTTGKKAYRVFGKPNPEMINGLISKNNIARDDIVMIGDRIYTDIEMANNAGIDSILVLSGDTSREDVEKEPNSATFVLKDVSRIFS
ncbi:HAD-IIA family hydrolase [Vibrio rotiferianus]|uniref:HAD-IIA family hydrolase n=1 Tax=Vibrio rotiferianus TaxID=190895 RepID=UPI00390B5973